MRPVGERFAGLPPRFAAPALAAAALCFAALFWSGGFDDAALVWIGGLTLALAALTAAAAFLGPLPAPRLDVPAGAFLGCLFGLAAWAGLSTFWSISPDRSWAYTNRSLVYAAFALLGVLLSAVLPRVSALAGAAAALLGLVLGWALLAKCIPALYSDYGRVARLRAPVAYWNELALLCDVAVPVALWVAAARSRPALVRAAGVLLLFAATVTLLLTYSRVGVLLACLAAAAWIVLDHDRVESLVTLALGGGAGAAVYGIALALPGITSDGEPHSVRVHDGWIFALVLLAGAVLVVAAAQALARLEARRPLGPERRRTVERAAGIAALVVVAGGIAASVVYSGRIWREFTNPVTSQISSSPNRLSSVNSSNRWRWWSESWQAFTHHPAGGTGAGTFEVTDLRLRQSPLVTTEPHNVPLQFLAELGSVGFLLYVGAAVAAALAIVRARRRAAGAERAAVTALAIGLAAFLAHTVVDMDWNYVATCGPLLFLGGCLVARPRPERARRPILALVAAAVALAIVYSLAAPWLANRQLASASTVAQVKHARSYDPLSVDALLELAALEAATGNPSGALQHYTDAVKLEPENAQALYELGAFYFSYKQWTLAYDALNNSFTYDRFGPASKTCGLLDQARAKAHNYTPPKVLKSCPGLRRPAKP